MQEISLVADDQSLPINNFLIYGDIRSGKTTFLGSFPRTVILADKTEKGWESLIDLPDGQLFEPGVKPIVWAIETMADMMTAAIPRLEPMIKAKQVLTVGIDSGTFYSELALAGIMAAQGKPDNRKAYGDLGAHLRAVRVRLHSLGVNVVWLALAQNPDEDNPKGKPMIAGRAKDQIAAACDYIWYSRFERPDKYEIRTRQYGAYIAGHRRGLGDRSAVLPDPLVGNYSTFLEAIGYDVDALRKALPPIGKPVVAKPIVAKPIATPVAKPVTRPATTPVVASQPKP